MNKNRKILTMLVILVTLMGGLSIKLILLKNKYIQINNFEVLNGKNKKNVNNVEKYGYSEILDCLSKNKDFEVESIDMVEDEKFNVQVNYIGDIKFLYYSLSYLNESINFLGVNKVDINNDSKIINLSMIFIMNK